MLGRTEPRLWTPPLRELTPDTSYGFDVNRFARDTLRKPADPWQEWLNIHAGELLPDGRPRFRIVLVLVARQNGKTFELILLSLYWQFIDQVELVLGTSTKLDYARESWQKGVKLAEKCADLDPYRPPRWKRETNGEQVSWIPILDGEGRPTGEEARYKIAASNEEGGRSLTIDRLICDEIRQHHDYSAWEACEPAASPPDAQIFALSNAGDSRSVVLNDHRDEALKFIEWWDEHGNAGTAELLLAGEVPDGMPGDHRLGLFEWSSPEDADPTDIHALAQANPNMNRRTPDGGALQAKARRAVAKGGEALTGFKTENMCINVRLLNPAIDAAAFRLCKVAGTLAGLRPALVIDVAPDEMHVTAAVAAMQLDGLVRGELVAAWKGAGCVDEALRAIPGLVETIKPKRLGWFPSGPGAVLAARLKDRKQPGRWPPRWLTVDEIRGEVTAVCMGFAERVRARGFVFAGDPLLTDQVLGAEKLPMPGGGWVFSRRGGGHVDAVYAMAGAVHIARTMPAPLGKPRLVRAKR